MVFEALDFTSFDGILFGFIAAAIVLWFALLIVCDLLGISGAGFGFLSLGMLLALGFFASVAVSPAEDVTQANKVKAAENLKAKYNVKDVLWDDPKTTAASDNQSENEKVVVLGENDQRYIFDYIVTKETSEPTLIDLPIQGGATPDSATTAKALLKQ